MSIHCLPIIHSISIILRLSTLNILDFFMEFSMLRKTSSSSFWQFSVSIYNNNVLWTTPTNYRLVFFFLDRRLFLIKLKFVHFILYFWMKIFCKYYPNFFCEFLNVIPVTLIVVLFAHIMYLWLAKKKKKTLHEHWPGID